MSNLPEFDDSYAQYQWRHTVYIKEARRNDDNLFHSENMVIEIKLQFLIGIVDTELFKAVVLKHFKSKNIQNSN